VRLINNDKAIRVQIKMNTTKSYVELFIKVGFLYYIKNNVSTAIKIILYKNAAPNNTLF
jgi:hypothetical protein